MLEGTWMGVVRAQDSRMRDTSDVSLESVKRNEA